MVNEPRKPHAVRLTDDELAMIRQAAERDGSRHRTWMRAELVKAAERRLGVEFWKKAAQAVS